MSNFKKSATILFFLAVLALLFGGFRHCRKNDLENPSKDSAKGKSNDLTRKENELKPIIPKDQSLSSDLESLIDQLNTSIEIYGKVVDQYGDPVSGAEVILRPINRLKDSYGQKTLKTDEEGKFSAQGMYGKSLGVSVSKEGYLRYPPLSALSSSDHLAYSGDSGGNRHADPSNRLVLELLKIGTVEPMIHVKKKRWKLPLEGTPLVIGLDTEDGQGKHAVEFRFKSDWNKLPMDNEINSKTFDWSFEIRIPGGGLIWDGSDVAFEAPESGYEETIRYEYLATMPREEWKRLRRGRYFVKFADGTYGRIQFEIDGSSDRKPLYMESWLSLKPDSRNLATENMIIEKMEVEAPGN